jgi:predicted transcriptional regulator
MSQKIKIRKRKIRLVPDAEQGAYIMYRMRLRDLTQNDIAAALGISSEFVHMVIWGKKTSARVQKQIALSLGFSSWIELLSTRKEFAA